MKKYICTLDYHHQNILNYKHIYLNLKILKERDHIQCNKYCSSNILDTSCCTYHMLKFHFHSKRAYNCMIILIKFYSAHSCIRCKSFNYLNKYSMLMSMASRPCFENHQNINLHNCTEMKNIIFQSKRNPHKICMSMDLCISGKSNGILSKSHFHCYNNQIGIHNNQ